MFTSWSVGRSHRRLSCCAQLMLIMGADKPTLTRTIYLGCKAFRHAIFSSWPPGSGKYDKCEISGAPAFGSDEVETEDSQCPALLEHSNLLRDVKCSLHRSKNAKTIIPYHVQSLLTHIRSFFYRTVTYSKTRPIEFTIVVQFGQEPPFEFDDGNLFSSTLRILILT